MGASRLRILAATGVRGGGRGRARGDRVGSLRPRRGRGIRRDAQACQGRFGQGGRAGGLPEHRGTGGPGPALRLRRDRRELPDRGRARSARVGRRPGRPRERGGSPALLEALGKAGRAGGRVPPLLVAAQEGGVYRSFPELPPSSRAIDLGDSPDAAMEWASETAAALRRAGFDLNLFPVADVATLDSPVAGRSFSDDSVLTAELTAAAIRGCRDAGLACAPLHFPGLGAASQDTAEGPATVSLDAASLNARDLEPFRAAIAEDAPAIVLSLAFYSAYDAITPGALAPEVATRLLRDQLRFKGVAITDDLGRRGRQGDLPRPRGGRRRPPCGCRPAPDLGGRRPERGPRVDPQRCRVGGARARSASPRPQAACSSSSATSDSSSECEHRHTQTYRCDISCR